MDSQPSPLQAPDAEEVAYSAALAAVFAGLVVLVGAAAIWGSLGLGYWTELGPGPGFFPFWLGVLLVALGGAWLARSWAEHRAQQEQESAEAGRSDAPGSVKSAALILGSLVVLTALLNPLGYQLAMLLFLLFHLKVLGRRSWVLSVILALTGSVGIFVIFTRLLTVNLPVASIPFLAGLGF